MASTTRLGEPGVEVNGLEVSGLGRTDPQKELFSVAPLIAISPLR
jgi:hypothetical protein